MNRIVLPLVAMALSTPAFAQSTGDTWAGNYLGVQLGNRLESSFTLDSAPGLEEELDGIQGGGHFGFRRQRDAFVYGAEIEFLVSEPDLGGTDTRVTTSRIGGTFGYDLGRFLPYGTAGIGRMTFQDTIGFGDTSSFGTFGGLGVLYSLGQSTDIGVEAVRESYQNFNEGADNSVTQTTLSAQFNINF
ncbi:outer membrane protein [Gymnodinialimonas ulvae]|uniref:outer membrane protein n=1 Tax=Gymnodinialimonas ulvae TaxID=3126504 RepID=UPI0030B6B24C